MHRINVVVKTVFRMKKEDVSGLLTDRLDKAKEQLEDSLEALRALCEPVAPPKDMVDYYHYFCGANTEAFDLDELEENMPKREQLYNLSATALRAFGEVSGELPLYRGTDQGARRCASGQW